MPFFLLPIQHSQQPPNQAILTDPNVLHKLLNQNGKVATQIFSPEVITEQLKTCLYESRFGIQSVPPTCTDEISSLADDKSETEVLSFVSDVASSIFELAKGKVDSKFRQPFTLDSSQQNRPFSYLHSAEQQVQSLKTKPNLVPETRKSPDTASITRSHLDYLTNYKNCLKSNKSSENHKGSDRIKSLQDSLTKLNQTTVSQVSFLDKKSEITRKPVSNKSNFRPESKSILKSKDTKIGRNLKSFGTQTVESTTLASTPTNLVPSVVDKKSLPRQPWAVSETAISNYRQVYQKRVSNNCITHRDFKKPVWVQPGTSLAPKKPFRVNRATSVPRNIETRGRKFLPQIKSKRPKSYDHIQIVFSDFEY